MGLRRGQVTVEFSRLAGRRSCRISFDLFFGKKYEPKTNLRSKKPAWRAVPVQKAVQGRAVPFSRWLEHWTENRRRARPCHQSHEARLEAMARRQARKSIDTKLSPCLSPQRTLSISWDSASQTSHHVGTGWRHPFNAVNYSAMSNICRAFTSDIEVGFDRYRPKLVMSAAQDRTSSRRVRSMNT